MTSSQTWSSACLRVLLAVLLPALCVACTDARANYTQLPASTDGPGLAARIPA